MAGELAIAEQQREAEEETRRQEVLERAHSAAADGATVTGPSRGKPLLGDLSADEGFLRAAAERFRSGSDDRSLSYAAEWMLDNFHLALQALRQIQEDMPDAFYRQLPKLAAGPLAGYPRIYDVAQRLSVENSLRLNMVEVGTFVSLYQDVTSLATGELWALPVMLRLSVLDGLERAVAGLTGLPRSFERATLPMPAGLTADEIVANCFTSLRAIAAQDWQLFFEGVSRLEQILRDDPAGLYAHMERETRDQYRKAVEELAFVTGRSEQEVASAAIELARAASVETASGDSADRQDQWAGFAFHRSTHIGYYLLDKGREQLNDEVGYRPGLPARLSGWALAHPTLAYLAPIAGLTLLALYGVLVIGAHAGASPAGESILALLALIPLLSVSVAVVDWVVTLVTPARILPKMDFRREAPSGGIPAACRTLVVVPSLLGSADEVESLLQQIELHYLRNPDDQLFFGLVTDFLDASEQHTPDDDALLAQAQAGIRTLNERYAANGTGPFCLFHRERRWNTSEERWIGWERKRGKLHELNRWLRGASDTSFIVCDGPADLLRAVKYVITLDADTILGRDGADRLVGALAHPLNQARIDPRSGLVVKGFGILQPRTEILPTSANRSPFSRIFAGDVGLDLYTHAVSNVYQDLFGSGIYTGKGIYDVDAFERSLAGRVPENSLLSHDLFEGIHARAGLISDIVVYEEFPPSYLAHARRLRRWVRGDWQLLPWLLPRVPAAWPGGRPNDLRLIDRWKLLDNLRRSLLPPALLLLLIAAWAVLPGPAWLWTALALLVPAVPAVLGPVTPILANLGDASWSGFLDSLRASLLRWMLAVAFLPYEAAQMLGAIGSTLVRLLITRKRMLQWTTAAETARRFGSPNNRREIWLRMRSAVVFSATVLLLMAISRPANLTVAIPLLLVWALGPEIAFRISQPILHAPQPLSAEQTALLRTLARRTWLFFERFVGPEDHWLPPDHFQEQPRGASSPYTSPTNIGLLLLSTLAAYDLGYIGSPILVIRLQSTFETLARLERYRGHFLNWYDTRTLEPLSPRYVSTVDSGNMAACLLILRQALNSVRSAPLLRRERWEALADTFMLLDDFIAAAKDPELLEAATDVRRLTDELRQRLTTSSNTPSAWMSALDYLAGPGWNQLDQLLGQFLSSHGQALDVEPLRQLRIATDALNNQILTLQRYVRLLVPWLLAAQSRPDLFKQAGLPFQLAAAWDELEAFFEANPSLEEHAAVCAEMQETIQRVEARLHGALQASEPEQIADAQAWCRDLRDKLTAAVALSRDMLQGLEAIDTDAEAYFQASDFSFLFDSHRQIFHIGYNVTAGRLDDNYYDLLASEARIASVVALAKREAPPSHWLHLARPLTEVNGARTLLSWSATMFEYLMPSLFMRSYAGTLLYESEMVAASRQIEYGRSKGVPWGISESGYYAFDASQNFQYRAFGVPGLGFKRNLADDLVVAPYASLLALPYEPREVVDNMAHLVRLGSLGIHGFYEAIDFTRDRLPAGTDHALVQEYMAHHQGMILLALVNHLQGNRMVERFHADPRVQAVELLLQERVPPNAPLQFPQPDGLVPLHREEAPTMTSPWAAPIEAPVPQVHSLSNGRYSVLVTGAGTGFSRWQDLDLTRWRADATLDDWGSWMYIQDLESGKLWSATYQPTGIRSRDQGAQFFPHMAEYHRTDDDISIVMQITVAPEEDVEIRRISVLNQGEGVRRLALTSYAEIVMAPTLADQRHPAFNKLFIESEYLPEQEILVLRRRPRSEDERRVYLAHLVAAESDDKITARSYESDRAQFLGRGGDARRPTALLASRNGLSGTVGATLDPIMAMRAEISLGPGETVRLAFVTSVADSDTKLLEIAGRYRSWPIIEQAFAQSSTRAQLEMNQMGLSTVELEHYQRLLSVLLYPYAGLRADAEVLARNAKGPPGLWAYGISGDYPLLLVRTGQQDDMSLVHELLQAHTYWRRHQLKVDLVILNERAAGYGQELREQLHRMLVHAHSEAWLNQRGGIFLINSLVMSEADRVLIETAARAVLDAGAGSLAAQLEILDRVPNYLPAFAAERAPAPDAGDEEDGFLERPSGLLFDNGLGGFTDGEAQNGEYAIYLKPGQITPAPWVNVIANEDFGFVVSESGSSYTWAINSGENRLTPWSNDPVSDPPGETLYLRDEQTGVVWSPTPAPCPAPAPYLIRHGAGYTIFEHHSHGLKQRLRVFAVPDAPAKIAHLRLENTRPEARRITATFFCEWVLGVNRDSAQQFIVSEFDTESQTLLANNRYNIEFGERVAFATANKRLHGLTADRTEFLGRMGSRACPAGLGRIGLASTVRAGLDPCAALQLHLDLPPGASEEIWFVLGQAGDRDEAMRLAQRYKEGEAVEQAWQGVARRWEDLLGAVQVHTPDRAMDLLLNRWLLYQALACRIWGRSALYQSSGAFGFRDQLQDIMAVVHVAPKLMHDQILLASEHQFEAGDVLHWWHPPSGRGVRTRVSDDRLWLPFVTAHYVASTGDCAILDEETPFLRAAPLRPDEEDRYGHYPATTDTYTLYEHCRRALEHSATSGPHGLPLMGAGDWNDSMNRVGIKGRGESIWLGWFLYATLTRFADIANRRGDAEQAARYFQRAEALHRALEEHTWDGDWYLRAYYDDGAPLGSRSNQECQIDSIAQSWAALSGAGNRERALQAMNSVLRRLVNPEVALILLFTPPFDKTPRDPGYVKGYPPGIRENGGQYTHAALWSAWAFAELGDAETAECLFRLLNPIYHVDTADKLPIYKVEPYVVAADVYGAPPHTGRGGWTWYTGSAGWMYRLGLEGILGVHRVGESLDIKPRIPKAWPGYEVRYRYGRTTYRITVRWAAENSVTGKLILNGKALPDGHLPLNDDGQVHVVEVTLPRGS